MNKGLVQFIFMDCDDQFLISPKSFSKNITPLLIVHSNCISNMFAHLDLNQAKVFLFKKKLVLGIDYDQDLFFDTFVKSELVVGTASNKKTMRSDRKGLIK